MSKSNMGNLARKRRHSRVRKKISGTQSLPRLNIYRSANHIYAQIIDDSKGSTLVSASSLDKSIKTVPEDNTKTKRAQLVGELVARRAIDAGIKKVVFDRGGYKYHGRVKALADTSREAGLLF